MSKIQAVVAHTIARGRLAVGAHEAWTCRCRPSPQEHCINPQSNSAQRPILVLQLFKRAVDGYLDSRGPEVDISVHSNTSGEQECVSAKNDWISIKGFSFQKWISIKVFFFQNATSSVLLAVLCYYFLLEKEGWAAERSRSETNVVSARHSRGPSARLR